MRRRFPNPGPAQPLHGGRGRAGHRRAHVLACAQTEGQNDEPSVRGKAVRTPRRFRNGDKYPRPAGAVLLGSAKDL